MADARHFKTQHSESRAAIERRLRTAADQIEQGTVHLQHYDQSQTVTLPDEPTLEVDLEKGTDGESDEVSFELEYELSWTR
jgi:amphi-Trp domain-containing protein